MINLSSSQRRYLSRLAHDLDPAVMVGKKGFTEEIVVAVEDALSRNELLKIRFVDFKADRIIISDELAGRVGALIVRIIGNVAIMYRPHREAEKRRISLPA